MQRKRLFKMDQTATKMRDDLYSEIEDLLSDEQLAQLKKELVSGNIWHTYKKQYPWKPEVTGPSPLNMWLETFNGEDEFFDLSKPMSERTHRAIPKNLSVSWISSNGKDYFARITLNEEQVIAAFKSAYAKNPDEPKTLQLKIIEKPRTIERNKILRTVEVYLKGADAEVRLKADEIKIL